MADLKLDHVSTVLLGVRNIDSSLAFYNGKLGIGVDMQFEGFAFLRTSGISLVLSESLARATNESPGAAEIVFAVDGVREAHSALREKGIEFTHEPHQVSGPQWGANFRDPDGHFLSVLGPEERSVAARKEGFNS